MNFYRAMLVKIHNSYRKVVAVCDSDIIGKRFDEGKRQLDIRENFYKGDEVNEEEAIITSMNLYVASQDNVEMGVLLTKKDDSEAYDNLWKEVKRLNKDKPKIIFIQKDYSSKKGGFCIRCKTPIKLDPNRPYCMKDYEQWDKFKDKKYEEKKGVCHICGKSNSSSMEKPVCINCYNKNKPLFKNP